MASLSPISCRCNNTCNRTSKRGACACRTAGRTCTDLCDCGWNLPCCNQNSPRRPDIVSSSTCDDWFENNTREESTVADAGSPPPKSRNKRKKSTVSRRLINSSETATSSPPRKVPKSDVPKATQPVQNAATTQRQAVQTFAESLDETSLRQIVVELLSRDPGAFDDYARGYRPQEEPPQSPPPAPERPAWCRCGNCRKMASGAEDKCCWKRGSTCCATQAPHFYLVVEPAVLDLAMAHYNDFMANDQVRDNASYRHQAYTQFTLQRFGKLGAGNRRVVPSCVVLAIRERFPDPQGQYVGFLES